MVWGADGGKEREGGKGGGGGGRGIKSFPTARDDVVVDVMIQVRSGE